MGRVETMLLNFCTQQWTEWDVVTRARCVRRLASPVFAGINVPVVRLEVWRCFYRRHPDAFHEARAWSRTASRLLDQFEAEDAAEAAMEAIDGVLNGSR